NYDPEPMGIAPLAGVWAREMTDRGHQVEVIAAHPHYPDPIWGTRLLAYRETRESVPVTRLPLMAGRGSAGRRLAQEATFLASLAVASPFLGRPDLIVSTSPSFPALLPAMAASRLRRVPWFIWLQDILPDGAVATGYLENAGAIVKASRRLERAAYRSAAGIVVLSESFRKNLLDKGVPDEKITVAYNPATISGDLLYGPSPDRPPEILCMGNIGRSQGLPEIVRDFESEPELAALGARLVIAGSGVAEGDVREAITTDRVEMTGLLDHEQIKARLRRASLGAVTQSYDSGEFNVPSKLMNYLAAGAPVIASVRPTSEACRIVTASDSGWIAETGEFGSTAVRALRDPAELRRRSANGHEFARRNLTAEALADRFETAFANRAQKGRRT
ncbi:MAG: glycosyltransferase family 4 protein, partial [Actinomycetota bacterium]|nr:glycosyltransferase family 4 protein [Actinomycetota bacterium]